MNTTQTDNRKKQETAKEILRKHGIHELPDDEVKDILAAMKEIADKAWEAGSDWQHQRWAALPGQKTAVYKDDFMKGLFPEDKTGHSES